MKYTIDLKNFKKEEDSYIIPINEIIDYDDCLGDFIGILKEDKGLWFNNGVFNELDNDDLDDFLFLYFGSIRFAIKGFIRKIRENY